MNLATQNHMSLIPKEVKSGLLAPKHLSNSASGSGVIRTFKDHHIQYSEKDCQCYGREPQKKEYPESLEGLQMPSLIRKKLWNSPSLKQFLLEKMVSRCYPWLYKFYNSQSRKPKKRLWIWQKKNADADECFWISTRQWGRQWRSSTRKQTDIRQSSKRFQLFKSALDLF